MNKIILLPFLLLLININTKAQVFKFDIDTADATYVTDINDSSNVCGYFIKNGITHAFFSNGGTAIKIDQPISDNTWAMGLNNKNQVAGYHNFQGTSDYDVFVYNPVLGLDEIVNVTQLNGYDPVVGADISDDSLMVGDYKYVSAGNPTRRVWMADFSNSFIAYNYDIDQQPGFPTFVEGVNNSHNMVGYIVDGSFYYGWYRDALGATDTFKIPSSNKTRFTGISNNNYICGYYTSPLGTTKGFYMQLSGAGVIAAGSFTNIEIPGAVSVYPMGINNKMQVCGYYTDANSVTHGFVIRGYDIGFRPHINGWNKENNLLDMHLYIYNPAPNYNFDIYLNNGSAFPPDPTGGVGQLQLINESGAFPEWDLFVRTFKEDSCYITTPSGKTINPLKLALWYSIIKNNKNINNGELGWNGSCSGFTYSSLFAFDDLNYFNLTFAPVNVPSANLFTLNPTTLDQIKLINSLQYYQIGREQKDWLYNPAYGRASLTVKQTLSLLKQSMLDTTNFSGIAIRNTIYNPNTDGVNMAGHSMVPYKIKPSTPGFERIYVYDSNHPGDTTRFILVNTNTQFGDWTYNLGLSTWGNVNGGGLWFDYPTLMNQNHPSAMKPYNGQTPNTRSATDFLDIYYSNHGKITFSDVNGNTAIDNHGDVNETTPNGKFFIPNTSDVVNPNNYLMYDPAWHVGFTDMLDTVVTISVFTENTMNAFTVATVDSNEANNGSYSDDNLTFSNPDNTTKDVQFTAIIDADNSESYTYTVSNLSVNAHDSVSGKIINGYEYEITNYGSNSSYDVNIYYISGSDVFTFTHSNININNDATHIIHPFFVLGNNSVEIYVDEGSDGSNNDTLFTNNLALPQLALSTKYVAASFSSSNKNVLIGNNGAGILTWSIATADPWIQITSAASGTEDGSIDFTLSANSGNYRIGYIIVNSNDASNTIDTITVYQDGVTGIAEAHALENVIIYPNPTTGIIYIQIPDEDDVKEVSLIDINGRAFTISECSVNGNDAIKTFDMKSLPTGLYILRIVYTDKTVFDKVIKY